MSHHPLDAHALPGIGPLRLTRLTEAGITTLEDLLGAPAEQLAGLSGFNATVVDRARAAAAAVLAATPVRSPAVVELAPDPLPADPDAPQRHAVDPSPAEPAPYLPEPGSPAASAPEVPELEPAAPTPDRTTPRLRRGLDAARRLEAALEWVGRARDHAVGVPTARARKRLAKQLKKLAAVFEHVQHEAIARGASSSASDELGALLDRVEQRLRGYVGGTPTAGRSNKLRRKVRAARRDLEHRIR